MAINSDMPVKKPSLNYIIGAVTIQCDRFLTCNVGIGWNDLADNTCVEDFVCEEFFTNDKETQEHIVKDICWDKLDLDETIYRTMTYSQVKDLIYGEDR